MFVTEIIGIAQSFFEIINITLVQKSSNCPSLSTIVPISVYFNSNRVNFNWAYLLISKAIALFLGSTTGRCVDEVKSDCKKHKKYRYPTGIQCNIYELL